MSGVSISVPNNLPRQAKAQFIDRSQALETLHSELQRGGRVTVAPVNHSPGMGKTELALQYAQTYWRDYPGGICWVTAATGRLEEQVLEFVKYQLGLDIPSIWRGASLTLAQQLDWCWQHWQPEKRVLIVIEEAPDLATCRRLLLPQANQFHVIVTALDPDLVPRSFSLVLDRLSPADALQLLCPTGATATSEENTAAAALCQWLDHLPLALQLVGAYLADQPGTSLAQVQAQLQAAGNRSNVETAEAKVKAALELVWSALQPDAQTVACLLSLFAPTTIPLDLAEWTLQGLMGEPYSLRSAYGQLKSLALVEPAQSPVAAVALHPLIRSFFREKLALGSRASFSQAELERALAAALAGIARKIPQELSPEMAVALAPISAHLATVVQHYCHRLDDQNLIWPFIGLGRFYQAQRLFSLAEPWWQACLTTTQQRFGDNHPDVAFSLNNLALICRYRGYGQKAEAFYQRFIEKIGQLFEEDHPTLATGLNNLAALYRSQGRLDEAELLYQKSLAEKQTASAAADLSVITSWNNLAELYRCQGRYSEAEPLYHRALTSAQQLLGREHPIIATCLNNLAQLYCAQERYREAATLHKQALKMRQRLFGRDHTAIATSLNNLAELYRLRGRYRKAENYYLKSLEMTRRTLGEEHPSFASGLNNLGVLYAHSQRFDQATTLLRQALTKQLRLLGEAHPDTQRTLHNLESVQSAKP
jgi:tetratricopeptide (TPR) repeat protein